MPGHVVTPAIFQNRDQLEKFLCPKCTLLLKDAVQPSCGHWLCQTCAETLFAEESFPRCPRKNCGDDLTSEDGANYFPDRFVRREILNLAVVCPYLSKGCEWKGRFSDFNTHLRNCQYAFVKCNHCHRNVPASEMDAHSSVCPKVARHCPLLPFGCKETGLVSDMQSHIADNLGIHMTVLANKVIQLSDSVQRLQQQQKVPLQRMEADGGWSTDDDYTSLPDRNNDVESDGKLQALNGIKIMELQKSLRRQNEKLSMLQAKYEKISGFFIPQTVPLQRCTYTTVPIEEQISGFFIPQTVPLQRCTYTTVPIEEQELSLKELVSLPVADEWYQLGIQLDLPLDKLNQIKSDYKDQSQSCLTTMFSWWQKNGRKPTRSQLAEALKAIGRSDLLAVGTSRSTPPPTPPPRLELWQPTAYTEFTPSWSPQRATKRKQNGPDHVQAKRRLIVVDD